MLQMVIEQMEESLYCFHCHAWLNVLQDMRKTFRYVTSLTYVELKLIMIGNV